MQAKLSEPKKKEKDMDPPPSKLQDLFQDELPVSLVFPKARHSAALNFKITATVAEEVGIFFPGIEKKMKSNGFLFSSSSSGWLGQSTKRLQFLLSGGFDPQLLWKCEISAQVFLTFHFSR